MSKLFSFNVKSESTVLGFRELRLTKPNFRVYPCTPVFVNSVDRGDSFECLSIRSIVIAELGTDEIKS